MSCPRPPKLIRNSTPTMLMSEKINPSRSPTKMVGSAAGKSIFQNCWDAVRLKLFPTLIRSELDPDDVDEREDHPEPQPHEDGRQRGGKENLPELLGRREIEALPHVDPI